MAFSALTTRVGLINLSVPLYSGSHGRTEDSPCGHQRV